MRESDELKLLEREVRALFELYSEISERRFSGVYSASDYLIDFDNALKRANLTDKQRQALRLVYVDGLQMEEAAKVLGISKQAVSKNVVKAMQIIAKEMVKEGPVR